MADGGERGRYEDRIWEPRYALSGRQNRATPYRAFVPDPITDFDPGLSAATSVASERAGAATRELNGSGADLRSLEGLARQLLRSEALASSAIEELQLSHRKLARAEMEGEKGEYKAEEVLGNVRAMEEGIRIGDRTDRLTTEDVCAIHRALAIVPPLNRIAGELRREQGWIGGHSPPVAAYVPPPHEYVAGLVDDLCEFMDRDDISPVAQAAVAHAQFETIHPFGDGNGRVGRCLIHVLFRRTGIAPNYVPPVSLALGADKNFYIAGLEAFRVGDVDGWVSQFSAAVEAAARYAQSFSADVSDLQEQWLRRAGPLRADAAARAIVELLPSHPIVTAAIVEQFTGRSRVTAINGLDRLAEAGILTRRRNQRKGDSWEAKELFELLGRFEEALNKPGPSV
jgi:Fic family protein